MNENIRTYRSPSMEFLTVEAEVGFAGSGDFLPNDFQKGEEGWLYGVTSYPD